MKKFINIYVKNQSYPGMVLRAFGRKLTLLYSPHSTRTGFFLKESNQAWLLNRFIIIWRKQQNVLALV